MQPNSSSGDIDARRNLSRRGQIMGYGEWKWHSGVQRRGPGGVWGRSCQHDIV